MMEKKPVQTLVFAFCTFKLMNFDKIITILIDFSGSCFFAFK